MEFARRVEKVGQITQQAGTPQLVATNQPEGHQPVLRKDGMTVA